MHKKYYFSSILFFISFLSLAQTKKDTLLSELKLINIHQIHPTDSTVFELLRSLSTVYKNENPDSSIYYANTILDVLGGESNDRARLNAHTNLAQAYYVKSNSTEAFIHSNKSLEYAKNLNDLSAQLYAINGLGLVYLLQNKLHEAIRTFDKSLVLAQEIGDEMRVTISYFNKSIAYDDLKNYDSAMVNVNKAISLSRKNDYREKWSMALNRKGIILSNLNRFDQSIIAHTEAIALIEASNKWELCFAYAGLSKAYNGINDFNKSIFYGKESLKIAQSLGAKWDIFHSASILSETYEKQGNYKEAFNYYKIYKTYNDSIFTEKSETKLATLRLEQSNKEKEEFQLKNQLQAEVITQQRYQLALIILAISILAILLVYIFINAKSKKKIALQVEAQRDELELLNISKDKILSVLAHDMRSPINSILGLLYLVKHSDEQKKNLDKLFNEVYERTTTVSTALNNILEWSMNQFASKKLSQKTVDIQELVQEQINLILYNADKKKITITHNTANSSSIIIEPEHLRIIIRNVIANSIKFTEQGKNIFINYKDSPPFLSIEITDEGQGMSMAQSKSLFDSIGQSQRGTLNEIGTGLGLSLCKEYIELNGGQIKVASEEGVGTTFTLLFKKA